MRTGPIPKIEPLNIESTIAHQAFEFLHGEAELTPSGTFGTTSC